MDESDAVFKKFRWTTDADWMPILARSVKEGEIDGIRMPTFPDEETQTLMHGDANEQSLRGAFNFYGEIKAYAGVCERTVEPHRRLLDFGCGWGRMVRPFMKDIHARNLFGAEPHHERIVLARRHNPNLQFIQCGYLPPLPLVDNLLDYVIAFSVFSHLDEYSCNRWIDEFYRVLAPGGLVLVTTQRLDFVDFCEALRARKRAGETLTHPWHLSLVEAFKDVDEVKAAYQRGSFLFAGAAGSLPRPNSRYSETIISPSYVRRAWGQKYHVIDFMDDPKRLGQALIVMQKPS